MRLVRLANHREAYLPVLLRISFLTRQVFTYTSFLQSNFATERHFREFRADYNLALNRQDLRVQSVKVILALFE